MKHTNLHKNHFPASTRHRGFTLVEVLAVIAIMTILLAAGAIGVGNLSSGKGTASSVAICESLFEEARSIAVSKRCKARVMIDVDNVGSENYLRRVVIAHEKVDANGPVSPTTWVLASRGYEMPKGTFFSRQLSKKQDGTTNIDSAAMTMENESGRVLAAYTGTYAYYEFNAEGIFPDAGSSFVVGGGVRPQGQEPRTTKGAARDLSGFVIWRNGRTSSFRNPEQIPNLPAGDNSINF